MTAIEVVTTDVDHFGAGRPVMRFAMTPAQAQQWAADVAEMKKSVLRQGSDYDTIPGTKKPSLLKPGAEMLLLAAGLGFEAEPVQDDAYRNHEGATYRCTVKRGDQIVASCDGYAGYDESRFYVSAADAEAKEKADAAHWKRAVKPAKFVEYRAPWNSVIKMAQKRALVGAALNATAGSGLFTQDVEDMHDSAPLLFDAALMVRPRIEALGDDHKRQLREWFKANNIPPVDKLTPDQVATVLVEIGVLLASVEESELPPEPATTEPPAATPTATPEPPTTPEATDTAPEVPDPLQTVYRDHGMEALIAELAKMERPELEVNCQVRKLAFKPVEKDDILRVRIGNSIAGQKS